MIDLKHIYKVNFMPSYDDYELMNAITCKNLNTIFPNCCMASRVFCALSLSVVKVEYSFSRSVKSQKFSPLLFFIIKSFGTRNSLSNIGISKAVRF